MPLTRTTWGPDTCDCRITFEVDTAAFQTLVPDWVETLGTCSAHAVLIGQTLYEALLGENRRKNVSFSLAKDIDPGITVADFSYSFDGDRVLHITVAQFNPSQNNNLQAACDLQFGAGLVVVE